ncbi:MAG: PKD domain-containing protein [Bradymonadia bacterium]
MTHPRTFLRQLSILLFCLGLWAPSASAFNQAELEVVPVPFAPNNLDLPYPVHEYARISLKAILRGATCASGYDIAWDTNRDTSFDDETSRRVYPTSGTATVYDIGQTFEVPTVNRGTTLTLNVRARSRCNASDEAYGTYRIYVYDWTPSSDPTKWTQDQREVMTTIAIHEGLWWLHRDNTVFGGTGSIIWGRNNRSYGGWRYQAAAAFAAIWSMSVNGRMPAYPPGSFEEHGHTITPEWYAANDERWLSDPYAETMVRWVNFVTGVNNGVYTRSDIPAADEANTCGWNDDGTERFCDPIPGTDNGVGAMATYTWGTYDMGLGLGALATLLPVLAETPVQEGHYNAGITIKGKLWKVYVQEMVDWLGTMQGDVGCAMGGWLYGNNANGNGGACNYMDASTAQWAYIGLESADVAGKPYGVIVNNRHKYRTIENLFQNQNVNHGSSMYRSSSRNSSKHDFHLTGGAFVAARWAGIHNMEPNDNRPFAPYVNRTQREMVDMYNRTVSYTATHWNTPRLRGHHWTAGLWKDGDYLCGTPVGVYNAPRCGHTYAMYSHQKGYRTGTPELLNMGGHDWVKEFSTYYIRAQSMHLNDYTNFGHFFDDWQEHHSASRRVGLNLASGWAILTLTPSIFRPIPVAQAEARPTEVNEGCSGGGNGVVLFDHSGSFHPNRDAEIISYQWDFDKSDGFWWDTGAQPDYQTANRDALVEHTYWRAGTYTATLRVVDDDATSPLSETEQVQIRVNAAPPTAPGVITGGPYIAETDVPLQLNASASDANLACGDSLTARWDLDGDGAFDDAVGLSPTITFGADHPWVGAGNQVVQLQVTDSTGLSTVAVTKIAVFPREPVLSQNINPNPATCRVAVRFDASASYHANPNRRVVNYSWDLIPGGSPEFDGADSEVSYTYTQFGSYPGTLTITDDLGRTQSESFTVQVDGGNRAPLAVPSQAIYSVTDGEDLRLDGSGSSDPDGRCGDSIVEYAWDVDGNGSFNDPVDARGVTPVVPWALLATMNWPADRNTGLPVNPISLRVTDSLGLTHTAQTGVSIYQTRPVAVVVQSPSRAPVNQSDGEVRATFDGRASHSPIPGVAIVRYDWDLNDDGIFETQNQPIVQSQRVFWPLPDALPDVFIRLRVTDEAGRTQVARVPFGMSLAGATPPTAVPHLEERVGGEFVGGPLRNGGRGGYHFFVGNDIELDASASFDPDEDDFIARYRWDLDGDGEWDMTVEDEDGDGAEAEVVVDEAMRTLVGWDAPGTFVITLEVTDTGGLTEQASTEMHLYPSSPTVSIEATPSPAACNGQVTLDASDADQAHPEVDVVAWRWDLDDDGVYDDGVGRVITTRFDQFSFGEPEVVRVEIEDSAGNTAQMSTTVVVSEGNRDPVAEAGGYAVPYGGAVSFDGRGSTDLDISCGDAITAYRWDLNRDGVVDATGAEVTVSAQELAALGLGAPGQYTVSLDVVDRFGRQSTDTAQVWLVGAPIAVAQASKASAGCNEQVTFTASSSSTDGPDGDDRFLIEDYLWDMDGDGVFERSGETVLVPMVAEDSVTATLMVVDALGRTATDTVSVSVDVANVRPVADAGGPYVTALVNGNFAGVDFDARGSLEPNAPCDHIELYAWDTDNDGLYGADDVDGAGGLNGTDHVGAKVRGYVNPEWRTGTTQVVRLKVLDAHGAWSEPAEAEIRVRAKMPPVGELVWPRGGDCVPAGADPFQVSARQPDGGEVTFTVRADGVVIGSTTADLPANGEDVVVEIPVNANLAAEGMSTVTVTMLDDEGAEATISAGGQVPFDRTGPSIALNAALMEGACYAEGEVPAFELEVEDALDPAPAVQQVVSVDACVRTVDITATDACGNTSTLERSWLIAEQPGVELVGPDNNEVVSSGQYSWNIDAPAACVAGESASVSVDGGSAFPYIEGTDLAGQGEFRFELTINDCAGSPYTHQRRFRINAPPEAMPGGPYTGDEGEIIFLDAGRSTSPEASDFVAQYEWDMNRDGTYELAGAVVPFVYPDSGQISGRLRVTDSFGATDTAVVVVTVAEVHPIVDAGGPYIGRQGQAIEFDASGSRPGSAADLLTRYEWDFGDGSPVASGIGLTEPQHIYVQDGTYTARLTVHDEDSSTSVQIPVIVADAAPNLSDITGPEDAYEVHPWTFSVVATPGDVSDPIQRLTWDFGDGTPVKSGFALTEVQHAWRTAGTYTVTVTAIDEDSESSKSLEVEVRQATLGEIITIVEGRAAAVDDGPVVAAVLEGLEPWIAMARWGDEHGRMGNTMMALRRMVELLINAQSVGADIDDTLWLLMRQIRREIETERTRIVGGDAPLASMDHPSVVQAEAYLAAADAMIGDPDYEAQLKDPLQSFMANDVFMSLNEVYFYLNDAADPCKAPEYNNFEIPFVRDLVERAEASQSINDDLNAALDALASDLRDYIALGLDAPGRAEVVSALQILSDLQLQIAEGVGLECDDGSCISDRDALELVLGLMDLSTGLTSAANQGVHVRNWQACIVEGVKFRTALSEMRLEYICGPFSPVTLRARVTRANGLRLVDEESDVVAALDYFQARSTRCLAIWTYNSCLVPAFPNTNVSYPNPEYCSDDGAAGDGGQQGPSD